MGEKVICPKCGRGAYTSSPQIKSTCPYCRVVYSQELKNGLRKYKQITNKIQNKFLKNPIFSNIENASGKKIIIVDDDVEFLEELKEMLTLNGYNVTAVSNGITVIDEVRNVKPDVVLLDLKMEGVSGFWVADELKIFPETKHIPIIAMTGFYKNKELSRIINFCGIRKCLRKPFAPLDVVKEIETALK